MSGVDLRTVQELMGHKTIQMTVRYAHLAPEHRLAAVQRLCNTEGVHKQATDTRSDTIANADIDQGSLDRPQTIDYTAVQ
jgi:Phage integrase family